MKRILQVVSCLALGGTEAFIMNNYRQLDPNEYQFDFMVFFDEYHEYMDEIKARGGRVFFCGPSSLKNIHQFTEHAVKIMKENGPYDAVHSHVNIQNGLVLRAAYKAGIPKRVSHSHDTSGKFQNGLRGLFADWKVNLIKKYATDFLACSVVAGNYLYGEEFFSENGKMIFNGIDLGRFCVEESQKSELKIQLEIPDSCDLIVGNITRFDLKKNPIFSIKVFYEILKMHSNAILLLGGPDCGQLQEAKDLVNALGISDHVRFIGPRKDIPVCLGIIDIYLFPSLFEGLPFALLEAQAAGCFCVASTDVSLEASVVEGSTIFIDLNESPKEWCDKIVDCFEKWTKPNKEEIKRCFCERGFAIESSYKALMEVYNG